jgi:hypothetical protein
MYTHPHTHTQDAKKARGILTQACDEGIPDSCYALASHLLRHPGPNDANKKQHKRDPVQVCWMMYMTGGDDSPTDKSTFF